MSDERLLAMLALVALFVIGVMMLIDSPIPMRGGRCWIVGHWEQSPSGALVCVIP